MKYAPLPVSKPAPQGLRPVCVHLDSLVQSLRTPLPKKAPRKLEKAR